EGKDITQTEIVKNSRLGAPFNFQEQDSKTGIFQKVDEKKCHDILKELSPINHISKNNAPMLIMHGDKDRLVPIQQARVFTDRCKTEGVTCELVVKEGADHGWADMGKDVDKFIEWFDKYLKK